MSEPKEQSRAQQLIGDFAPKLAELTDDVLFGDVWQRTELSPRDRSLITHCQWKYGATIEPPGSGQEKRPLGKRTR